jgi:outer membrane protein OmpA-like peptidoglycan-associated protein
VSGLTAGDVAPGEIDPLIADFDTTRIKQLAAAAANPLTVDGCQRMMRRIASVSNVRFPVGSASPTLDSYPLLNDLAKVLSQCPEARIVIGSHSGGGSDERGLALGRARAEAIERFFSLAGIEPVRMTVVAYGNSQSVGGDAAPGGAVVNRITFDVLPRD